MKILTTLFLFLSFNMSAQIVYSDSTTTAQMNKRLYRSGTAMKKYAQQMGIGTTLLILGGAGATISAANKSEAGTYVCAGFGVIGALLQLTAPSHLKRAGNILQQGRIVVPLNKK